MSAKAATKTADKKPIQQSQQGPLKLHWSPLEPSWLLSIGLILLAVLPHQIPAIGRRILTHPIGALLFAGLAAFVWTHVPVLGAAMVLFLAGVLISSWLVQREGFAPMVLNKEGVEKKDKKRWLNEEILSELPDAIQEKTDRTYLNYDEVTEQESAPWAVEDALGEHPVGIQDRAISTEPDYDDSSSGVNGGSH